MKNIFSIVAILAVLSLSLVACSGGDAGADADSGATTAGAETGDGE